MAVCHFACFSVLKPMWAEVEDSLAVVGKGPEPQIDQVTELIHRLDVQVSTSEIKWKPNNYTILSANRQINKRGIRLL